MFIDSLGRRSRLRLSLAAATLAFPAMAGSANAGFEKFHRVSAFPVFLNTSVENETSAEIVAAAQGGNTLIYTDAPLGMVGFIDITDPAAPLAGGAIAMPGGPTAVATVNDLALVAVNTSRNYVSVSGTLVVIDVATQAIVREIDLGGQPDSVAISPDQQYAAVVIENERDEDLGSGEPPQLPAGYLVIVDLVGEPADWSTRTVDLTGIATLFPEDPEPEFVDINEDNIAVVSLQENNHIAIVDLVSGDVMNHFEAGTVDLTGIDTDDNGLIQLDSSLDDVAREPDAVGWISRNYFATANEGDLFGGSRGFTIFSRSGAALFDAGNALEHEIVRLGHFPEDRADNKGNEPEGVEYAEFGKDGSRYLFIGSERSSTIAVYGLTDTCDADLDGNGDTGAPDLAILLGAWGDQGSSADLSGDGTVGAEDLALLLGDWGACSIEPELLQVLPTGVSPEGLLAIPERDLFVVASEVDARGDKIRATVSIYERGGEATYPSIVSAEAAEGGPIPWAALSALAVDPSDSDTLYSVYDSYYRENRIFTMDISASPAVITAQTVLVDAEGKLATALADLQAELPGVDSFDPAALVNDDGTINVDPEGVAVGVGGGFWVASEGGGNLTDGVNDPAQPFTKPNLLLRADSNGDITDAVLLPLEINRNQFRFGFEGVTAVEENGVEVVYVCFQRRWSALGDPANHVRIGRYDTSTAEWSFALYPLTAPQSPNGGWVGLSEIVSLGDSSFAVIERDDQAGPDAAIKHVVAFSTKGLTFKANNSGGPFPVVTKELKRDLLAEGDYDAGVIQEKLEGMAVLPDGRTLLVNDNDGVEDSSGETRIFDLGILFGR